MKFLQIILVILLLAPAAPVAAADECDSLLSGVACTVEEFLPADGPDMVRPIQDHGETSLAQTSRLIDVTAENYDKAGEDTVENSQRAIDTARQVTDDLGQHSIEASQNMISAAEEFYQGVGDDVVGASSDAIAASQAQHDATGDSFMQASDDAIQASKLAYYGLGDATLTATSQAIGTGASTHQGVGDVLIGSSLNAIDAMESSSHDGLQGGVDGYESVRYIAEGVEPSFGPTAQSSSSPLSDAGRGYSRPDGPADPDHSYFNPCVESGKYKIVAFPNQKADDHRPYISQCRDFGVPVAVGSTNPIAPAACGTTTDACFWFGLDGNTFTFDIYNSGGRYGFFYMVRLVTADQAIDIEVPYDNALPEHVGVTFRSESGTSNVNTLLGEWNAGHIDAEIASLDPDRDFIALRATLGFNQGNWFDLHFGRVWDGQKFQGATPDGPYRIILDHWEAGGTVNVDATLSHASAHGAHVLFSSGPTYQSQADFAADFQKAPQQVGVGLATTDGTVGKIELKRVTAVGGEATVHLFGKVLEETVLTINQLIRASNVVIESAMDLGGSTYGDVCDQDAAEYHTRIAGSYQFEDQVCIAVGATNPAASVHVKMDEGQVRIQDLSGTNSDPLHLTLGPGSYLGFRSSPGNFINAVVSDLKKDELRMPRLMVSELASFRFLGHEYLDEKLFELDARFGSGGVFELDLAAEGIEMKTELRDLARLYAVKDMTDEPIRLLVEGDPIFRMSYLEVYVDKDLSHYDFNSGSAALMRTLEVRVRDKEDTCRPGEWNCWPALAITTKMDRGGFFKVGGHVYHQKDGSPDFEADINIGVERGQPSGWTGNDHDLYLRVGESWCSKDDHESGEVGDNERLNVCSLPVADVYLR